MLQSLAAPLNPMEWRSFGPVFIPCFLLSFVSETHTKGNLYLDSHVIKQVTSLIQSSEDGAAERHFNHHVGDVMHCLDRS